MPKVAPFLCLLPIYGILVDLRIKKQLPKVTRKIYYKPLFEMRNIATLYLTHSLQTSCADSHNFLISFKNAFRNAYFRDVFLCPFDQIH